MIGEIYSVGGNYPEHIDPKKSKKIEKEESPKKTDKQVKKDRAKKAGDSLDISINAKEALIKKRYVKAVKDIDDIREDKVADAKESIDSGEIDSPERIEKLADILDDLL